MLRSILIPALLLAAGPGALRAQTDYYVRVGAVWAGTLVRDVLGTEITVRQAIAPMAAIGASMPISPGYRAGVEATVASGGFDAQRIREFEEAAVPVDAYGVGTSLLDGRNDYTADVVRVEGVPCAKVGREEHPNPRLARVA